MIPHGRLSRYTYHKCRCNLCRWASAKQKRKERARRTPEQVERDRIRERALKDIRKAWKEDE